ncbi:group II truncated hemoglobin [Aquabacterium sp. J223]|uniref:group II truncated hemoglobin n=1 Tax=Aquabacterium sp. J223 TaxID=2898431 RepID=UPI0021AD6CB1|nr:group II truncated hemoglobin [Aquabacterium sp. J223]UUX95263.1 group II truncated hemoglobin [Aquabacterium sp. J223]
MSAASDDAPAATAFDALGGEAVVRRLVDRFYDLMDLEPGYADLRALHPTSLDGSRDKLFWFLCGWLGGPSHYTERFGHPRLRARHLPYAIGIRERDQWLACMAKALRDEGIDADLAQRLVEAFFNTADWMRNKGG